MKNASITRRLSLLAVVGLLPAGLVADNNSAQMQKEGIQLIRQVEEVARDVRYNAQRLNSFAKDIQLSKWTHYHHLEQIKGLVNDGLRPALTRLVQIQPQLPDWKQESIDRMFEAARTLAADTNSAILTKNDAGVVPPALNTEYHDLIARINEHAEILVKTSDAAGTYAAARLKADEAGVKVPKK
jgi:hypothetical protein